MAVPVLSGYGPVGASSASVPFFDGKREDFADFSYKLRAVLLEHNIDDIVFNPTAFQKQCDIVARKASLRSASLPKDPADDNEQQRAARNILLDPAIPTMDQLDQRKKLASRIIISRLSAKVSEQMRVALPEDLHFDALSIYTYLSNTYSMSTTARRTVDNPEAALLALLRMKKESSSVFAFTRAVQLRLSQILAHPKYRSSDSARKVLVSLATRHVINTIEGNLVFNSVHEKYYQKIVDSMELPSLTILDEMVVDIERVHLAHPVHPSQAPHARKQDGGRGQPQRDRDHVKPGAQPSKAQHGAGKPRGESAKQSGGKPGQPKSSVSVSALSADPAVDEDAVKIDCYLSVVSTVSSPIPPSQRDKHNKVFLVDSGATHHCVRERSLFSSFRPGKHIVRVANDMRRFAIEKRAGSYHPGLKTLKGPF
jgi:hypothetical protein